MAGASFGLGHETYYCPPLAAAVDSAAAATSLAPADFGAVIRSSDDYYSVPFAGGGNERTDDMYDSRRRWLMSLSYDHINTGADDYAARGVSRGAARSSSAAARIGFRTRSEVEVMDDGFKWRKYGKKAVKSSPNPRNYYRCSAEGCGVKKLVERDRDDPRYVLTTYDGVHNHASPGTGQAASPAAAAPCSAALPWTWSDQAPRSTSLLAAAPAAVDEWVAAHLLAPAQSSESSY